MADGIPTSIPFLERAYSPQSEPEQGSANFLRAFESAQNRRIQERELRLREALLPLQQEISRQSIAKSQLDILKAKTDRDVELRTRTGRAKLSEAMSRIDWSNPADRRSLWQIGVDYPELVPEIEEIEQKLFLAHDKAVIERDKYKGMLDLREQQLDIAQTRADIAKTRAEMGPATVETARRVTELRTQAEAARASGDTARFQSLDAEARLLEQSMTKDGQAITVFSEKGTPLVQVGGAPTTAMATAGQKRIVGYEVAVQGIQDILGKVRPEDVGVHGVIGENIFDTWIEQVAPGTRSTERIENRAALRTLGEQLIEALSADTSGRFSDADVKRIKEISGSVGASKSVGEVRDRLTEVSRIIKDRTRIYAERTGQPIPDFAKEDSELVAEFVARKKALSQAVRENRLTAEQAQAQLQAEYERIRTARRRYHGVAVDFTEP